MKHKCADQSSQMYRLVCAFVVRLKQKMRPKSVSCLVIFFQNLFGIYLGRYNCAIVCGKDFFINGMFI